MQWIAILHWMTKLNRCQIFGTRHLLKFFVKNCWFTQKFSQTNWNTSHFSSRNFHASVHLAKIMIASERKCFLAYGSPTNAPRSVSMCQHLNRVFLRPFTQFQISLSELYAPLWINFRSIVFFTHQSPTNAPLLPLTTALIEPRVIEPNQVCGVSQTDACPV